MTDDDWGLSRRTWLYTPLVLPVTGLGAIAAAALAVTFAPASLKWGLGWGSALAVIGLGLLWNRVAGAESVHRRVAQARARWAQGRADAHLSDDGDALPNDAALMQRHPWRVHAARGRVRFMVRGVAVHAETWVLRAMSRSQVRREIVAADVATGQARMWVALGPALGPLLEPRWVADDHRDEPAWSAAVRRRAAQYQGVPAGLAIGDGSVIVIGIDDARIETMLVRAELVGDVVRIIASH